MVKLISRTKKIGRAAFTMIELIFAIVLIGVTVLTVPMMIETNNKALESNIAQEAIFLTSAVLSLTTTMVWDNRSIVSTGSTDNYVIAKILDIPGTNNHPRTALDSTLRAGGIHEDKHRQFFDYNVSNPAQFYPAQTVDISMDFEGEVNTTALGYKYDYGVVINRGYVSDNTNSFESTLGNKPVSNLKMTEVQIYDNPTTLNDDTLITVLRAYTANIGEVDYAKRSF